MDWKTFKALGTDITVVLNSGDETLIGLIEGEVALFEKKFSRFLSDSELSLFNASAAHEIEVSPEMSELLSLAKRYHKETGGIFDPTVISNLEKFGYSMSFEKLPGSAWQKVDWQKIDSDWNRRARFDNIKIEENTIVKPSGLRLDFGGFGKGYIVDKIADKLLDKAGKDNYWLSAGGDIIASGHPEESPSWKISVQDPLYPDRDRFIFDTRGEKVAIATSGVIRRSGGEGESSWHHLVDPRTGRPSQSGILAVTVFAPSALEADIFAKTALIMGQEEGMEFLEGKGSCGAIMFLSNGKALISKTMQERLSEI